MSEIERDLNDTKKSLNTNILINKSNKFYMRGIAIFSLMIVFFGSCDRRTGKLTYSEVTTTMKAALTEAKTQYNFLVSNCFHVIAAAMRSIDLYDGGSETIVPNTGFYNIYEYYNPKEWYE